MEDTSVGERWPGGLGSRLDVKVEPLLAAKSHCQGYHCPPFFLARLAEQRLGCNVANVTRTRKEFE